MKQNCPEDTAQLVIGGEVAQPSTIDRAALAALPDQIADVSTIVPGREGSAVRVRALLAAARPLAQARYVTLRSGDRNFSASLPIAGVMDAVVVYALAGEALPADKGGPFRLLIPKPPAATAEAPDPCANVKNLIAIELSTSPGPDTRPTSAREHAALHRES